MSGFYLDTTMDTLTLLTLLAALLSVLSTAEAEEKTVYFKLGGGLVLTPAPPSDRIRSLSWKHNEDLVAEWVDPSVALEFFGVLKDRATLDLATGVLTMTNMTKTNEGVYAVEINDILQGQTFRAREQKEVPDPKVAVSPLVCSAASTTCILTCEGDTTGAEAVTYYWKLGEGEWELGQKEITITNAEEESRPKTYTCRKKNEVSVKDSPAQPDPFSFHPPERHDDSHVGTIVGVLFAFLVILAAAVLSIYLLREREPVRRLLIFLHIIPAGEPTAPHTNGGAPPHPEANSPNDSAAVAMVVNNADTGV